MKWGVALVAVAGLLLAGCGSTKTNTVVRTETQIRTVINDGPESVLGSENSCDLQVTSPPGAPPVSDLRMAGSVCSLALSVAETWLENGCSEKGAVNPCDVTIGVGHGSPPGTQATYSCTREHGLVTCTLDTEIFTFQVG